MTTQEKLMLARLKGLIDGRVTIAKACVRAAFETLSCEEHRYGLGYRDSHRHKTVEHLRAMRDVQRHVHEFCKGVGYYA